jgi:hypothetical protein
MSQASHRVNLYRNHLNMAPSSKFFAIIAGVGAGTGTYIYPIPPPLPRSERSLTMNQVARAP